MAQTYDGATLRLYVNGVLDAQAPVAAPMAVYPVRLSFGHNSEPYASQLGGSLDEIRLWNTARTQAELTQWMSRTLAKRGLPASATTGLIGYWTLDEGSGDLARDTTGFHHDAQLGTTPGLDDADPAWSREVAPVR